MIPAYFPKIIIEEVDKKFVIVLWVTTGLQRPYKAPEHVTAKKDKKHYYYIRHASNSVRTTPEQERELINLTNHIPFDTRPNFEATEDDISITLLRDHLAKTKSKLSKQIAERGTMSILNDMQLLVGPPEQPYISNVALMMFCEHLDKFFPYTQVEIVKFPEGSINNPNNFKEFPIIKGSVPMIIKRTMQSLQDLVIEELITKVNYQMEAIRRFNYPYQTLEEAVVNAFYHRDYVSYEPVHIEIEPECINIISFPGIDRSISMDIIKEGKRFRSRMYRNRRLGEFLKELDLSEGHSTGIPTIQEELAKNGSPRANFYTDDDRRALRVEIPIHPDFIIKQVNIDTKKVDIDTKKVDIENLKTIYWEKLRVGGSNKITHSRLEILLHEIDAKQIFGRNEVITALKISPTAASNLIAKMRSAKIITAVKGKGKGKYQFVLPENTCNNKTN